MIKQYEYHKGFRILWEHAVKAYQTGNREPETFFDREQLAWMKDNGLKVMDLYDFAEDFVCGGEPDFETFLMISEARRDYFLHVMGGKPSDHLLDVNELPAKTDAVEGIEWLPRIIPKAKAKLKGEMPPELMYCCGGDRRFFKDNNVHPAEFLRVVWANMENDSKTIAWVKACRNSG